MKYEYPKIVVGSSYEAVLFAFTHKYPIVYTEHDIPFRFEYLDLNFDLSCVRLENKPTVIKTTETDLIVGAQKTILWERMLFLLSLDSKAPLSNLCKTLRCSGNKIICSNEYSKIAEIHFDTCYYFNDRSAAGFGREKSLASDKYLCYDWIALNRGGKQEIDYIETKDDLVREIWLYPSDRIDGNTAIKDACVVSLLEQEQINNFDYSETMARFKLMHEMEARGMKGPLNGYGPNGKPKHYKIRTSSIARKTRKLKHQFKPAASNIKVAEIDEKSLLSRLPQACLGYSRFLRYL